MNLRQFEPLPDTRQAWITAQWRAWRRRTPGVPSFKRQLAKLRQLGVEFGRREWYGGASQ